MPGSFDKVSGKGVKKADADKAVRKMQLIQEMMSGTAKFAPGEKEAVLTAMGISTKKKGGAVKKMMGGGMAGMKKKGFAKGGAIKKMRRGGRA